ncbi:flavodoxin [Levilactobacillus fujinensis]|uniref:Flavodoxin n=1 Tax=Levilactobacillus fujinensis TaxID=2486024 RepID=A0ABW1TE77_9LACO|nr:flavodoxin [Levilactobacillus fujinensis]
MPKQIVLYFSCTGHTAVVAQKISRVTGAQLVPLEPQQPYTSDDLDWHNPTSRVSLESADDTVRPAIQLPNQRLLEQADTVYLGAPIWWSQVPHVVNTLLETNLLRGKTVWQFCTSSSTPIAVANDRLRCAYPGIHWQPGRRFTHAINGHEVEAWLKQGQR